MKRLMTQPAFVARSFLTALAFWTCLSFTPVVAWAQRAKRPLTVADSIEATRVLRAFGNDSVSISHDGQRYLVLLYRGDLARNGSWVELLSGSTATLDAASRPTLVARLFSRSTAMLTDLIKNVRWLADNERVSFLWDRGNGLPQVFILDVQSHRVIQLTHHPSLIVNYDISLDGRTVIYSAQGVHDSTKVNEMLRKGFAITDQSIGSVLRGNIDGRVPYRDYDTFVTSTNQAQRRKVREPHHKWFFPPYLLSLSPDGRYAITIRPAGEIPADWDKYTEHVFKDVYLPPARQNPDSQNAIRRYYLVDMQQATARPLWGAPENPYGALVWSPDSRSLILGPTFLPTAQADATGLAGHAVVEIDIASGKYLALPLPTDLPSFGCRPLRWNANDVVDFAGPETRDGHEAQLRLIKTNGEWKLIKKEILKDDTIAPVRIEVRQDPNSPPVLYAVEISSGREKLIRDLNPQLRKEVTLGRVELVHWKGSDGGAWTGMLYYPMHYASGSRFPFVIQTHGYSATEFSLDGVFTTAFAAQPMANRDIAVLQVGSPDSGLEDVVATPREPEIYVAGYEGAIEHFTSSGLVDRDRVGIIGFSRTGWYVEYMLTHSHFSLAAAEVADNMDASYVQNLMGQNSGSSEFEADNGARPFGKGLETWLRVAPGFNADKIRTPLRLEIDSGPLSGSVLGQWEMFSNLRNLHKPVELFVIPDIEHGVHILQIPAQRLASQGGTVDWFCFWLKNEEDPDPAKAEQYVRWRELRKLEQSGSDQVK